MILKYKLTDNRLIKDDETMYPNHLQDNIVLEFDKDDELPNTKYYAYIKTSDGVKKVRMRKKNGKYSCELPPFVSHYTFFKLQVLTVANKRKFLSNELIIPFRTLDYLDYNRTINRFINAKYPLCNDNKPSRPKPVIKPIPKPQEDTGDNGSGETPIVVTKTWTVNVINLYLTWDYDESTINEGSAVIRWTPYGEDINKTTHIYIDGVEYTTSSTTRSGVLQSATIPAQTHGAHVVRLYLTATINE